MISLYDMEIRQQDQCIFHVPALSGPGIEQSDAARRLALCEHAALTGRDKVQIRFSLRTFRTST